MVTSKDGCSSLLLPPADMPYLYWVDTISMVMGESVSAVNVLTKGSVGCVHTSKLR
jgi:hypothetical protein